MDRHALHRFMTRWNRTRAGDPGAEEETRAGRSRARQEHLTQLRRRGIPVWTEEPEHCDACGRELLVGEQAALFLHGDELLLACPLCADRVQDDGALPVPIRGGRDGFEQLEIAS